MTALGLCDRQGTEFYVGLCALGEQVSGNTHHFLAHIFCPMSIAQFQMGYVADVLKANGATTGSGFPALS